MLLLSPKEGPVNCRVGTLRPLKRCQLQLFSWFRGPSPHPGCPSLPSALPQPHSQHLSHKLSGFSSALALPDCSQLWGSQGFNAGSPHFRIFWRPRVLWGLTYSFSSLSRGQGQGSVIIHDPGSAHDLEGSSGWRSLL